MTTPRDPDSIVAAWLEEGPNALPEPIKRAIAVNTRTMNQRRHLKWVPQRSPTMYPVARIAAAAIVVVAILGGAVYLLTPGGRIGGGPPATAAPSPAPSAVPSPSPSASTVPTPTATPPSTVGWLPFTSSHYGYSIAYPPTWAATQATRAWDFTKDRLRLPEAAPGGVWDVLLGSPPNGPETAVLGFAADVPAGTSEDSWLASYYAGGSFCPTMPAFVSITVDGHPGRLDPCYDAQAFVFVGHRVFIFVIFQTQMQPLFTAFLSTVKLPTSPPSGSPVASPSPS
jgi:hypothetical protein